MMKKTFILLFSLLCFFSSSGNAQEMYGWNLHDSSNPDNVGPFSMDISNPSSFKIIRKHDYGICAGAFAGKKYYAYTYKAVAGASQPLNFGIYDFATGDFKKIADYSSMTTLFYDMSYDYKNRIMYALGIEDGNSTLLKVNLNDGKYTKIATLSQQYVALACNLDGEIFVEDSYGYLTTLDKDGKETMLDGGDLFPDLVFQSMTFDHATEKLYWIVPTTRGGTQIMDVDPTTGYANDYYELANDRQVVGIDKQYSTVKPLAPGEISSVTIKAETPGGYKVNGTITAPSKTSDGSTLNKFSIHVTRNNKEIFVKKECKPGEKLNFNDTVTKDSLYTYIIYAENEIGRSEEYSLQVYIGIDTPNTVKNLNVVKSKDGKGAVISWTAPENGVNGGFIETNKLTYDITRQPDGIKIASGINKTSFTDNTITKLNNYNYVVTAIGKNRGIDAISESLVLGEAHELPYKCEFAKEDFVFWNIIDRNKDNTTWKKTSLTNGVSCSYSDVQGDDWLISYPISVKQDVTYKIKILASCYNEDMPEKMALYYGKGMDESSLNDFTLIKDITVTNEEGGRKYYTAYFVPKNNEALNIAVQMHSDPDMFELNVYSIEVSEASEGKAKGHVTDGSNNLEGATVILKNEKNRFETTTDSKGLWEIQNIPEGSYILSVRMEGYATIKENIDIVSEQDLNIDRVLSKLKKVTLSGKALRANNNPVKDAVITFTSADTQKQESTESDSNGLWSLEIYEGEYEIQAACLGLNPVKRNIKVTPGSTVIENLVLTDKAVAPRYVKAVVNDNKLNVTWKQPADITSDSYYKGEGVANIGIMMHTPNSIVGTVFRKDMALTKVKWQTDGYVIAHKKVDLVIFKLDENGDPTKDIICEKCGIDNIDNEWSYFEFDKPLIIKGGALIAFRYSGNIHMMADAGTNGGLEFTPRVHVINSDYTKKDFEYLDKHNMEKNLLIGIESLHLDKQGNMKNTIQCQEKFNVYRKSCNDKDNNWTLLGNVDNNTMSFNDKTYDDLDMGYYQYAVTSGLKTLESDKSVSNRVAKDLEAIVTFIIKTNAGECEGLSAINLTDSANKMFKLKEVNKNKWVSEKLPKGVYKIHAELDGFENFDEEYKLNSKENEYEYEIVLKERLLAAYNLQVAKHKEDNEFIVSWNTDNYFFDNFEEYDAFTIEPATQKNNWIYWDVDKDLTVEFENLSFKNMGKAMSFIVFNPFETEPNMTFIDPASTPYSGKQYLASFGNRKNNNEDYIFSPILNFKGKATLSFKTRNFVDQLGEATIHIGYTANEYPKTEADITWIEQDIRINDNGWENMSFDVPADAKRMVIMNNTEKGFFLMIDDLFVGEEYPFISENSPKPIKDRATYEVMLDGKIVSQSNMKETSLVMKNVGNGKHSVDVTAIYKSGRAETRTIEFENTSTDIDNVYDNSAYFKIDNTNGLLFINGNFDSWELYNINGNLVRKGNERSIDISCINNGVYVIKLQIGEKIISQKVTF